MKIKIQNYPPFEDCITYQATVKNPEISLKELSKINKNKKEKDLICTYCTEKIMYSDLLQIKIEETKELKSIKFKQDWVGYGIGLFFLILAILMAVY